MLTSDGIPPTITVTTSTGLTRVNAGPAIGLSGTAFPSGNATLVSTQWSVVPPTTADTSLLAWYNALITSPTSRSLVVVATAGFAPGASYTFRMSATTTDGSSTLVGYQDVTLMTNSPPSSGFVVGFPASGQELETQFQFRALQWVDAEGDLPLQFRFSFNTAPDSSNTGE